MCVCVCKFSITVKVMFKTKTCMINMCFIFAQLSYRRTTLWAQNSDKLTI